MKVLLDFVPPTTTSQQKRLSMRNGKPMFFKNKASESAQGVYVGLLAPHVPPAPVPSPVRLSIDVTWPWRAGDLSTKAKREHAVAAGRIPHTSKPDLDNFVKQLQDVLATMRFIESDQQVAELHVRKFFGAKPGLCIDIETVQSL